MKKLSSSDKTSAKALQTVTRKDGANITRSASGSIQMKFTKSLDDLLAGLCQSTGTRSSEMAIRIADQVVTGLVRSPGDPDNLLRHAISAITEMEPQNLTEAMLSAHMISANDASAFFLNRAMLPDQTTEAIDAHIARASRLMKLFLDQVEALQKLKGKAGQQRVVVEHVTVQAGGQAVVGVIASPGGDRGEGA